MKSSYISLTALCALLIAGATSCSRTPAEAKTEAPSAEQTTAAAPDATGSAVIELAEGVDTIARSDKPVVVDFNADWCGPCRAFKPVFDAVAGKYSDKVVFYSVDVDTHETLATHYGIRSIPSIVTIMPDGKSTLTTGFMEQPEFEALVGALL